VNPRVASGGGAWSNTPPLFFTVPAVAEGLPCNFWSFGGYFVNFNLFNVIFV